MSEQGPPRSEEHTSELQSHRDLHSFPTRRSSDLCLVDNDDRVFFAGPIQSAKCPMLLPLFGVIHGLLLLLLAFASLCPAVHRADIMAFLRPLSMRCRSKGLRDRKSTRLNSSHTEIYTLSLHDALPISVWSTTMTECFSLAQSKAPNARCCCHCLESFMVFCCCCWLLRRFALPSIALI